MCLASAEPSALPPPGLVRRLAEVERNRCRRIVAGRDVPPVSDDVTGFALDPARGTDEAFTAWHRETARRRELTEGPPLDGAGRTTDGPTAGVEVGPRRVLIRPIEEYARHNGKADLLWERVDGVTGS
ncbi:DUF664 domain-containing protein [Streptomyces sp. NPDC096538]|uniref:mycothiol transferase n=1 Tax=Streptomyces sp. NPDC096538 TaxID=3155427 RepID=UPI00331BD654